MRRLDARDEGALPRIDARALREHRPRFGVHESEAEIEGADTSSTKLRVAGSAAVVDRKLDANGKVTFGVRPEHIGITEGSGVPLAEVTVELVEQLGGQTMVYATTADGQSLTIAVDGQQQVAPGSKLTAYVDPARYHVFAADGRAV